MKFTEIQEEMKTLCQSKNWRNLVGLIDEGYRGTFVILRILNDSKSPLSAGDLSNATGVSTARIASTLNWLEDKNYVKRERGNLDGRKVLISLTDEGKKALSERIVKIEKMIEPMFSNLTESEIDNLFFILNKLLR